MSGTKNKLTDLNNHLFAQIERLADNDLGPEKIEQEAKRGKAIAALADQVIKSASLQVQVARMVAEKGAIRPLLPEVAGTIEAPQPKLIGGAGK